MKTIILIGFIINFTLSMKIKQVLRDRLEELYNMQNNIPIQGYGYNNIFLGYDFQPNRQITEEIVRKPIQHMVRYSFSPKGEYSLPVIQNISEIHKAKEVEGKVIQNIINENYSYNPLIKNNQIENKEYKENVEYKENMENKEQVEVQENKKFKQDKENKEIKENKKNKENKENKEQAEVHENKKQVEFQELKPMEKEKNYSKNNADYIKKILSSIKSKDCPENKDSKPK